MEVIIAVLFFIFLYFLAMMFKHHPALLYALHKKGIGGAIQMFLAIIIHEVAAMILP